MSFGKMRTLLALALFRAIALGSVWLRTICYLG